MRTARCVPFVLAMALLATPGVGAAQLGVTSPVAAQNPSLKGATLLADARAALGGDARVSGVMRIEAKGTFRRVTGAELTDGDFVIQVERPDKYRLDETSGTAGGPVTERTQALNGTEAWEETSAGDAFGGGGFRGRFAGGRDAAAAPADQRPAIDPERLKDIQRRIRQADMNHLTLAWLMTTTDPVTWIGTAESPDGNADVIEVKPDGGTATRVFLDVKSHLPLMLTWQGAGARQGGGRRGGFGRGDAAGGANAGARQARGGAPEQATPGARGGGAPAEGGRAGAPAGQPQTIEMHLSNYKAVDGVMLPHLISRGTNGQPTEELTVKSYKLNPNFKSNTFKKK